VKEGKTRGGKNDDAIRGDLKKAQTSLRNDIGKGEEELSRRRCLEREGNEETSECSKVGGNWRQSKMVGTYRRGVKKKTGKKRILHILVPLSRFRIGGGDGRSSRTR